MKKVKGFSYDTIKDKDVISHIDKQGNGSQYVWDLVRKDMKGEDIQELIKKGVDEYLGEIANGVRNNLNDKRL